MDNEPPRAARTGVRVYPYKGFYNGAIVACPNGAQFVCIGTDPWREAVGVLSVHDGRPEITGPEAESIINDLCAKVPEAAKLLKGDV